MSFDGSGRLVCSECGESLFHERRVFRFKKGGLREIEKEPAGIMVVCSSCGHAVGAAPSSSPTCIRFAPD